MIYCGYQGTGKSTYCRQYPERTIDFDSSSFDKGEGWAYGYVQSAHAFSQKDKQVFISAHRCVIETLIELKIPFVVLIPAESQETWRARLQFRFNQKPILANLKALKDFEENYEADMNYYQELEKQGYNVVRINAKIQTNLEEQILKGE